MPSKSDVNNILEPGITIAEVMRRTGLSRATINRHLCAPDPLPSEKMGRRRKLLWSDVVAYFRRQRDPVRNRAALTRLGIDVWGLFRQTKATIDGVLGNSDRSFHASIAITFEFDVGDRVAEWAAAFDREEALAIALATEMQLASQPALGL
jgi:hypothetical protein